MANLHGPSAEMLATVLVAYLIVSLMVLGAGPQQKVEKDPSILGNLPSQRESSQPKPNALRPFFKAIRKHGYAAMVCHFLWSVYPQKNYRSPFASRF